jgi:hypothetical protein
MCFIRRTNIARGTVNNLLINYLMFHVCDIILSVYSILRDLLMVLEQDLINGVVRAE